VTIPWWLTTAVLVMAAAIAGWPARNQRARRRLVMGSRPGSSHHPERVRAPGQWPVVPGWVVASPRRAVLLTAVLAGCAGLVAAGPVAAIAAAAYGGLAIRAALRRQVGRRTERERRRRLDALCALAADLRAGLPMPATLSATSPPAADAAADGPALDRITGLTRAAGRLAEQTGAPLADLVERIEADARAMDRGLAAAAAQAAGARATAWLLAALPLGGIALGYGIGVDPLDVLLHTPIGAGCALSAIVLQFAGLAWADRLSGGAARAA
jgi:tight adherence protein B